MSAAPLTLEYELSREEIGAAYDRHVSRVCRRAWGRKLGAAFCLFMLMRGWESDPWWIKGLLAFLALEMLLFEWLLIRWFVRYAAPCHVLIETDDRGLRIRDPARKLGSRYWWSRLSRVEQAEFGIELYFDKEKWSQLEIPWKAFASDDQRREFVDLVKTHAPKAFHTFPT